MVLWNQDNVLFPVCTESVSICQLYFVITIGVTGISYNGRGAGPVSVTIYLDLLLVSLHSHHPAAHKIHREAKSGEDSLLSVIDFKMFNMIIY